MRTPFYISAPGVATAQGCSRAELAARMLGNVPALPLSEAAEGARHVPAGIVHAKLPEIAKPAFDTRCNRLAALALEQLSEEISAVKKNVPAERICVVVGNSNSGVRETEEAICAGAEKVEWARLELGGPAEFVRAHLKIAGPAYAISTACSSAAKAFAAARRLLESGLCDAAIVGGCDSFCSFVQGGFASLSLISANNARPLSADRDGINIGEGAAFFVMTREPLPVSDSEPICLLGVGESSDAHHLTSPAPDGEGAERSMRAALADAALAPADIDYINLHGTGTPANDAMESAAVARVFGDGKSADVPASSSKPFLGHALGASGALEAAVCYLAISEKYNPRHALPFHPEIPLADAAIPALRRVARGETFPRIRTALSNSFAFGGSNASVILGRI